MFEMDLMTFGNDYKMLCFLMVPNCLRNKFEVQWDMHKQGIIVQGFRF